MPRWEDSELEKIARDPTALTDVARKVLRVEMLGRELEAPPEEIAVTQNAGTEAESPKVVMIRRYRDMPAASIAKSILDSAGVECYLSDENVIRMDWPISNALGGIKLLVREEDAEVGGNLLDQGVPEKFDVEGVGEYEQPRCPRCQSMDVFLDELYRRIAYPSLLVSLPIAVDHKGWNCHACGFEWQDGEETTSLTEEP
jgi:hypothetical protein